MPSEKLPFISTDPVSSLAYSPQLKLLAVGRMGQSGSGPSLSGWNFSTATSIQFFSDNTYSDIWAMCFDYTGQRLIYSGNGDLNMIDVSLNRKEQIKTENNTIVSIISSGLSGRIVVSGLYAEALDIDTGHRLWSLEGYRTSTVIENLTVNGLPLDWNPSRKPFSYVSGPPVVEIFDDGERILIGGHNKGKIELIELRSGKVLNELFPAPLKAIVMSLGCNEKVLAVSSKIPYANFLWELESGDRILPNLFNERFGGYSSLCLHPTRRLLASGSLVGFVSVQNLEDGGFVFSEQIHQGRVSQILFAGDSNKVFSGGEDGDVRVVEFNV